MTQPPRRTTIRDVAAAAGVSVATVSQTLNNKGLISPATRERVLAAAERLHYVPSAMAAGLRSRRSGMLALTMRPLETPGASLPEGSDYFLRFAGAAALSAVEHGYGLMLVGDPVEPSAARIRFPADGYLVADPLEDDPIIRYLAGQGVPLLAVGRVPGPALCDWLDTDVEHDTRTVLEHLAASGAREIALVATTDDNFWSVETRRVYRRWCAENGVHPIVVAEDVRSGVAGGASAAEVLLRQQPLPAAVFCLAGAHAAGLARRLRERGHEVPGEVLVAAGSDAEECRLGDPPVTALDLAPEKLAQAAVAALVARLEGKAGPAEAILRVSRLQVRHSTSQI